MVANIKSHTHQYKRSNLRQKCESKNSYCPSLGASVIWPSEEFQDGGSLTDDLYHCSVIQHTYDLSISRYTAHCALPISSDRSTDPPLSHRNLSVTAMPFLDNKIDGNCIGSVTFVAGLSQIQLSAAALVSAHWVEGKCPSSSRFNGNYLQ